MKVSTILFVLLGGVSAKLFDSEKKEGPLYTPVLSEGQVRSLFYIWNEALATGSAKAVAKRYTQDGFLLPLISDVPLTDNDQIKEYFGTFLQMKPQALILSGKIKVGDGWAEDAGIYEFDFAAAGEKVKARYSFVYVFEDGEWKISHHHSSAMPKSQSKGQEITKEEAHGLFYLWNDALATQDPDIVAQRYSKNAVLLPTVSDSPRTDYAGIKDYFTHFCKLQPKGKILESHVTTGPNWAKDVGIYEFQMGIDGSVVRARYSFIYTYEDKAWKILHHHSSAMPESAKGKVIAKEEVASLFQLWNKALLTLDADAVAMRYSKNAVLLPTVSDTPRTDYDAIKDYFEAFLQKKPVGKIIESYQLVSDKGDWAKDVGIYEFAFGVDGSTVRARYSFVYIYEDGEWKISHHHSSVMPESVM